MIVLAIVIVSMIIAWLAQVEFIVIATTLVVGLIIGIVFN